MSVTWLRSDLDSEWQDLARFDDAFPAAHSRSICVGYNLCHRGIPGEHGDFGSSSGALRVVRSAEMAADGGENPLKCLEGLDKVDERYSESRESYARLLARKSPGELRWWSKDTVAVVTGANKSIGLELVRQLATRGITTILTARDEGRGRAAVDLLKSEGLDNVLFHPLDVTLPASAAELANWIKATVGGIDILICNAGVGDIRISYEVTKYTMDTNYFGPKLTVDTLLPLLKPSPAGARIVFVSSECGQIELLKSEELKQQVSDIDNLTMEKVDGLANKYLEDVKGGRHSEWTTYMFPTYNESKLLLNAYGRLLSKSFSGRPEGKNVYVNMMTPGLVSTDMNGHYPGRTVAEGSDTAIWIALFPSGGPSGGFFRDRADFPF